VRRVQRFKEAGPFLAHPAPAITSLDYDGHVFVVAQKCSIGRIPQSVSLPVHGQPDEVSARFVKADRVLDVGQRLWIGDICRRLIHRRYRQ